MGACCAKASPIVDVDGGNWSEAYEVLSREANDRTRTMRREGTYSKGGANVKMDGSTLRQINDYSVTTPLGKGAYGEVFLAGRRNDREKYAIKVLKKSKLKRMGGRPRPGKLMTEGLSSVKVEIATMKKIAHPSARGPFKPPLLSRVAFVGCVYERGSASAARACPPVRCPNH